MMFKKILTKFKVFWIILAILILSAKLFKTPYYSQHFEDYILSYVLKNFETGTYIDVGANHPVYSSVTKHFYEKKWRGINIEPLPSYYTLLVKDRPRDINLNLGVSNKEDVLEFYSIFPESGLSTFDKAAADAAREKKLSVESIKIPVVTLDSIIEKHNFSNITFLKIDVENFEENVLRSISLYKYRPIIIVVEATFPCTNIPNHENWENLILSQNYSFEYFDGLNRYYLRNENKELKIRFMWISKLLGFNKNFRKFLKRNTYCLDLLRYII